MTTPDMDPGGPWQPTASSVPEPVPAEPAARAPRRVGIVVALVLAIVVALGFAAAFAWQSLARANWEAQNDALRLRVEDLTLTLSDQNARMAELEEAESQLETLKEEYSAAVNTGARSTEVVTELEQIVDAYGQCVEAQQEHFEVLRNADRYVASSIVSSERSIVEFCDQVHQSYVAFRAENG
ncbi:hypothetical protein QQX10_03655 [Demequina sp. SYSU T00039]|uniref:Uncharacterized protein n=1 Tax=Demequina lignilytica TaxID=3051663 RepID=A0AAW7LZW5_9MICO|nr:MULTISPECIES: hypothetical protein [unclassified Demequina]MDN4477085.1 hypothetical protein [Demequina sp. SYSU T00039-1]MDN4487258.1 hypothetical protein [Demequina sp. SYSU T00039]MDN4491509.1 hypothetical protein [Demequina sp. SYSU T00068]